MLNDERIGTIAIRVGNNNQEPVAVYVSGVNSFELLICRALNTGMILFSSPEKDDLLDFNMTVLTKLRAEWSLEKTRRDLESWTKRIAEGDY